MTTNPKTCDRCGQPHVRCSAHRKDGKPCGQPPLADQTVCRKHGGKAPQNLAAAARRRQERQALVAAESFGLPREVDPHTALLEELHRTAGAVQWLGALVADLERDEIAWGKVKETRGTQLERGTDNGTTYSAAPNAFVSLWQAERKHLVDVSRACISAGIEERRVRLAESAGQQLAAVIRSVLDRLELSDGQRSLAVQVVPDELRRLAGDVVVQGEVVGGGAA